MKENCSSILKLLDKYFDSELNKEEISKIESHLKTCINCQDELEALKFLRQTMKKQVEEALEKEDFTWVWQKIERGIKSQRKPTFLENLRLRLDISFFLKRKVFIPAIATICVLILILIPIIFKKKPSISDLSVVKYVESQTNNVMVYESDKTELTVIWLFETKETES